MDAPNKSFVHVLLFECSQCASPVCSALASDHRNMEQIDSASIGVACSCGWKSNLPATDAKRHWVDSWTNPKRAVPQRTL